MHRRRIGVEPLLQRVDTQQGLDRNVGNEALECPVEGHVDAAHAERSRCNQKVNSYVLLKDV